MNQRATALVLVLMVLALAPTALVDPAVVNHPLVWRWRGLLILNVLILTRLPSMRARSDKASGFALQRARVDPKWR